MNSLWKGNNKGVSETAGFCSFLSRFLARVYVVPLKSSTLFLTHPSTFHAISPKLLAQINPQKLFDDLVAAGTIGGATGGDEE